MAVSEALRSGSSRVPAARSLMPIIVVCSSKITHDCRFEKSDVDCSGVCQTVCVLVLSNKSCQYFFVKMPI
jgi:hypothetical protein